LDGILNWGKMEEVSIVSWLHRYSFNCVFFF